HARLPARRRLLHGGGRLRESCRKPPGVKFAWPRRMRPWSVRCSCGIPLEIVHCGRRLWSTLATIEGGITVRKVLIVAPQAQVLEQLQPVGPGPMARLDIDVTRIAVHDESAAPQRSKLSGARELDPRIVRARDERGGKFEFAPRDAIIERVS